MTSRRDFESYEGEQIWLEKIASLQDQEVKPFPEATKLMPNKGKQPHFNATKDLSPLEMKQLLEDADNIDVSTLVT